MSASDRSSARATELDTKAQATRPTAPNSGGDVRPLSGADGNGVLATSHRARIGKRGLAELRTALDDRDWAIIQSLDQLGYLTTRQVERLHYPLSEFTALSAARTARRTLSRLHAQHVIRHLERRIGGLRAGSASFVWTLDEIGGRLLNHPSRRRAQEPSRLHLDHTLAVAELVVQLTEVARAGEVEIVTVETEPNCWRTIPAAHGGRLTLKPDLRLILGVSDEERHFFVELDRDTEHRPVLARKCKTYLAAWQSGQEQAEHGVFPRVLWVVPDQEREAVIRSVIGALPSAPAGMFVTTLPAAAVTALTSRGAQP